MSPLSRDPEHLKVPAFMRKRELSSSGRKKLQLTAFDRQEAGVLPLGVSKKTAKTSQLYDGQKEAPQTRSNWKKQNLYDANAPRAREASLPTMMEKATTRRPGNMWEIAIANIHKEKHPEARVVPALKASPRRARQREFEEESYQVPARQQQFDIPEQPEIEARRPALASHLPRVEDVAPQHYYRPDRQTRLTHSLEHAPMQQGPQTQALVAVGEISQFYAKINVAVLKLDEELSVGDSITYQTPDGSYTQTVLSMEIDRKPVFTAKPGDDIGIKLYKTALVGKVVYAQSQEK